MNPSLRIPVALVVLLLSVLSARAETREFPELNFSIDIPSSWTPVTPMPPQAVGIWQGPDGKRLMVSAGKVEQGDKTHPVTEMRAGLKKGLTDNGWKLEEDQESTLGQLPSILVRGSRKSPDLFMFAHIASTAEHGYMCSFSLGPDGSFADAEAKFIAGSFRLLKPVASQPLSAPEPSTAYKIGFVLGRYAYVILGVLLLLVVAILVFRKRKP
jgi:hypothetical protein